MLATGLIRLIWHTPLLMYGTIPWYDYLFATFALQIFFTWLYNRTDGSMLIPMVCHLFSNVLLATMYPLFSGADQGQYWMLMVIAECVIMSGIVIGTSGILGRKRELRLTSAFSADI